MHNSRVDNFKSGVSILDSILYWIGKYLLKRTIVQAVMFFVSIREVLSSNLGRGTNSHGNFLAVFLSPLRQIPLSSTFF
jgi:hypothetical protein